MFLALATGVGPLAPWRKSFGAAVVFAVAVVCLPASGTGVISEGRGRFSALAVGVAEPLVDALLRGAGAGVGGVVGVDSAGGVIDAGTDRCGGSGIVGGLAGSSVDGRPCASSGRSRTHPG